MVGFTWSDDPEDYDGGSVAVHRACPAGEFKGDDPDKEEHPGPSGWGIGLGGNDSAHFICYVEKLLKKEVPEFHQGL